MLADWFIVRSPRDATACWLFRAFRYGKGRSPIGRARWIAALISWSIALFEYLIQLPANRIGYTSMTLPQLKMLQEAIALAVFVPFSVLYMKQPVKLDYLWACLCIAGALYFMFRGQN